MSRRVNRKEAGWDRMQVFWSYSVAFKKPRGKKLYWIDTNAQTDGEASRKAETWMQKYYPHDDVDQWLEYGISKSYFRHWGGYDEQITKDEYDWGVKEGLRGDPPAA